LNCPGGPLEKITRLDDVEDFAVPYGKAALVLIRHQAKAQARTTIPLGKGHTEFISLSALQVIPLDGGPPGDFVPLNGLTELQASCGTVLSLGWDESIGYRLGLAHDVFTGERVRFDPYKNFRCSSDRKVVAGWMNWDRKVLSVGVPPRQVLYDTGTDYQLRYDVSPNGKWIVYNAADHVHGKLCLVHEGEQPQCIEEGFSEGRISVADSGEVLFETQADAACYFKDPLHFSVEPRPGYDEGDLCPVLGYLFPGNKRSSITELLAISPQWVSAEAASALRAWAKRARPPHTARP
jgi:hypothetical protein